MGAAVLAAIGVGLLHLLSVRQPPVLWLPTARFVVAGEARTVARRPWPNDLLLLALRVAAVLLAGAAFAGARCHALGPKAVHLIVADAALRADSAAWWERRVAVHDLGSNGAGTSPPPVSAVHLVWATGIDTDPGAALVTAQREAARLAHEDLALEQVALTVVLPSRVRSLRGWEAWRQSWPGPLRVVRIQGLDAENPDNAEVRPAGPAEGTTDRSANRSIARSFDSTSRAARPSRTLVFVRSANREDPVKAAFTMATNQPVIILRDSADATPPPDGPTGATTVLVRWPRTGAPPAWTPRTRPDTSGAVAAGNVALVAPFVRRYQWVGDTSVATTNQTRGMRPLLWWADGSVAAVERLTEGSAISGCEREVYLPLADGSDLLLGAAAAGVRNALTAPCGSREASTQSLTDSLADYVDAGSFRAGQTSSSQGDPWWLTPVLLLLAVGLLLGEQWMRRSEGSV